MERQTARGDPTVGELWPQRPFRKGSWAAAWSHLPREPKRVKCSWPRPMARYRVTLDPNPDFLTLLAPPPPPLPPPALGLLQLAVTQTARACRRHWTRFASVGLIVWYPALGACFIQQSPKPTTTRRELLSMSPSLAADPSPSLLAPSQKASRLRYLHAVNAPAPAGQRPRHRPQLQHLDDNTPTRFPSSPPLNRVSESRRAQSTLHHRIAQHRTAQHNSKQHQPQL